MPSPWPDLSVNYAHAWTEISKGIDSGGGYYYVTYYIQDSWQDADTIINELLGYASRVGQQSYQRSPHQYPLDPSGRSLCYEATCEGVGNAVPNADGYPVYSNGYFIHAKYRVPPIPMYPQNDPENLTGIDPATPLLFASQDVDFETDFILLEKSQYVFASDSKKCSVPVKIEVGVSVMDVTFYRVPWLPMSLFRTLRGQVNNAPFLGSATGCVLFKGARTHRDRLTDGTYVKQVQLILHDRTKPWNQVYRPDTLAWDTIQDSGGVKPYTAGNLSSLLVLGQAYAVGG